MDWVAFKTKAEALLHKYKYVVIVVLAGILLMLLPANSKQNSANAQLPEKIQNPDTEAKLEQILSRIVGAGTVDVMLTQVSGEQIIYQTDETSSENSYKKETILLTDSDRNQSGLVSQVNSPVYLGAIVVCKGASDPSVRLRIVDAVSKATGLGADKISVLEMK